jgi:ATP-dependent exoDNAse (exonuclease V) alpha subunit
MVYKNKLSVKTWQKMDALVLDEVGMVKADYLEWLDQTVRSIRESPAEAFGGIQLIFVGDFAQLAPVAAGNSELGREPRATPTDAGKVQTL